MTKEIEVKAARVEELKQKIYDLQKPISDTLFNLNRELGWAEQELSEEVAKATASEFSAMDYHCGTVNLETAQFKFKAVVSKQVKWNEEALRDIENQIRLSGQDPEFYIKYKRSVSETEFKKFPENIQKAFEPARTVEPSKPKITWERK